MNASQELAQIINDLLKSYPPAISKALAERISQLWQQMIEEQNKPHSDPLAKASE